MIKSFLRKLVIFLIIALAIGIVAGSYFMFGTYSDGYRVGTVIKLSKKGYIFKTYEGQLNLEFFPSSTSTTPGISQNIWEFSVSSSTVAKDIEKAVDHGGKVKLYYDEKYYRLPWNGETKYIVSKIEEIPPRPN